MPLPSTAQKMEHVIREYTRACNAAEADAIAACFTVEAEFYFPWRGKWVGAAAIGENFAKIVREQRVRWTVDQVLTDVDRSAAVLEWSRFNPANAQLVRGVEWFVFEPGTLKIKEVRPYTAAPLHPDMARQELQDFDYEGRGYPTAMS
jgi:methyltransferase